MNEKLDITTLINSCNTLKNSIDIYKEYSDEDYLADSIRSGVIQNFEVSYELSWKFMKRWLELNISPDIVKGVSRKEFYRIAFNNLLISDIQKWWDFHEARNKTSHIYDEDIAEEVLSVAFEFLYYLEDFILELEKRL
ncbi:MAG: nucleotidyltransferase substrate binding protein [Methanobrevibacter sp.]|jgi:nucleotidyltransferase substrate binding protein (TIGR01987 family)|nr:nucleotidyltransferase substrate binding protein [Candidatus Methanovirga procula]